jgi:hypothetical protein
MCQVFREYALGMLTAERSTRAVARDLNVNFSTMGFRIPRGTILTPKVTKRLHTYCHGMFGANKDSLPNSFYLWIWYFNIDVYSQMLELPPWRT